MDRRTALMAVLQPVPAGEDPMTRRILDACYAELLVNGALRFHVGDVARRAGTARITIYRRFPNKAELVNAVLLREGRRLFAEVDATLAEGSGAQEQLVEGFVAMLTLTRRHPLVQRMLADEPQLVVPWATTSADPLISLGRHHLAGHLRRAQRAGRLAVSDPESVAELMVRLTLSFLLAPESCIPLETAPDARRFARRYLLPMVQAVG